MKRLIYVVLFITLLLPAKGQKSGIQFFHGTWDEAVALAKKEKKKIFIDFFTEWCGPCLNMALTVFPLPQVGDIYNKNFVCVKIDAEKGEGRELAKRYAIQSYPTYIFVDPKNQEIIHRSGGNKPVKDFLADVQGAINPKLSSVYLEKKFQSGQYDNDFLMDYIRGKKRSGNRDVEKLFAELLSKGGKLTQRNVWDLYKECITGYNNPYVKEVSDNYKQFVNLYGKKEVDEQLTAATTYAPVSFFNQLCDFDGKEYNIKVANLSKLFRDQNYNEAFAEVERMVADTTIDQNKLTQWLSFYVRVNPKYNEQELPFDVIVQKIRWSKYVAYNIYDRDNAINHYNYAIALEYLIQRAQQEGKQIPADLFETPRYGKTEYDMRHPLLKAKPKRK